MTPNQQAFLDMLAHSEIGAALLVESDNGYNVLVGSTPGDPHLFSSYADHPNILVTLPNGLESTGAGRYQLLYRWWVPYRKLLNLTDFGPAAQDAVALQQIRERGALPLIEAGLFDRAVSAVSNIWASLPGNSYGQHQNQLADLRDIYTACGGTLLG